MEEKITQKASDLLGLDVKFYKKTSWLLAIVHGSAVLRGVATTFFLAWLLPKEIFGQYRYILAIFSIAGFFSLGGLQSSVIRAISQGDSIVARKAIALMAKFAPLGSLALIMAGIERGIHGEQVVMYAFFIAGAAFVPYTLAGFYQAILVGKERIRDLSLYGAFVNSIFFITFPIAIYFWRTLPAIVAIYFGIDIILRGGRTVFELKRLKISGSVKNHLSLGKHLSAMGIFQSIISQIDQLLIQRFLGYQELALYSIIILLPDQIKAFAKNYSGIILRRFSQYKSAQKVLKSARGHFWTMTFIGLALAIAYAGVAPFLIPLLFPAYIETIGLSILYSLSQVGIAGMVGLYFFQAHHQIKLLWKHSAISSALLFLGNIILIPWLGLLGAVLARLIARTGSLPFAYPRFIIDPEKRERASH